jgi:hypothetical protein
MLQHTLAAIHQTRVVTLAGSDAFRDFPHNLPEKARESFERAMTIVDSGIKARLEAKQSGNLTDAPHLIELDDQVGSIAAVMLLMSLAAASDDATATGPDFERALREQELVMCLAHLEAFLGDTLKMMCQRDPRILRRKKQISWDQVIDAGSWEELMNRLADEYVYDFGWKSLTEKVDHLAAEHGVSVGFEEPSRDLLVLAEQVRHIVIHNGGRVSREFMRRTGRSDVPLGSVFPLTEDLLAQVSRTASSTCRAVHGAVVDNFFAEEAKLERPSVRVRTRARSGGLDDGAAPQAQ